MIHTLTAKSDQFVLLLERPYYWQVMLPISSNVVTGDYILYLEVTNLGVETGRQVSGSVESVGTGDLVVNNNSSTYAYTKRLFMDADIQILNWLGSSIKAQLAVPYQFTRTSFAFNNQVLAFNPITVYNPVKITGVKWYQQTMGSYTANNYNGVGLYSYLNGTLTLIASSTNDGNIWKAAGGTWVSKAFSSSVTISPGIYFVLSLYCSSAVVTAPAIGGTMAYISAAWSTLDFTNSAKFMGFKSTITSLPSTVAMSTVSANSACYWFGLY